MSEKLIDPEAKVAKLTVSVRVEYEDGSGFVRKFFMDPDKPVTLEQSGASGEFHLKVEGDFAGASNTPIVDPKEIDHRGFTF
jgi:hypothetical protein